MAQSVQPAFFHYTTEDGLPSSECYEILQDKKGYIWISTDNGVSRFDGYTFKNYGTEEGLLDKTVLVMKEDHRGWIWMSTFSGNFYIYRGDTIAPYENNHLLRDIREDYYLIDNFIVEENNELKFSLPGFSAAKITNDGEFYAFIQKDINSIYYDKDQKVSLYIPTDFTEIPEAESELWFQQFWRNKIFSISLYQKNNSQPTIYHLPADPPDDTYQEEGMRVQTYPLTQGLLIQQQNYLHYIPEPGKPQFKSGHSSDYINCIYNDKEGNLYVGYNSLEGLKTYRSVDDLLNNKPVINLLEGHTVSHVIKDQWGGLWVATIENGIFYSPVPENLTVKIDPQKAGDELNCIVSNAAQSILVAQSSGTVYAMDQNLEIKTHSFLGKMNSVNNLTTTSNEWLLVTNPLKFWRNNQWQIFKVYDPSKAIYHGLGIKHLVPSLTAGYLWGIHTARGLYKFVYNNQSLNISAFYPLPGSNKITALLEETPKKIWLGTLNGLFQLAETEDSLVAITGHPIYQERIEDICSLPEGGIAVATRGSGLYLLRGDSLTIWSEDDGLSANTVSHLQLKNNILWAVSTKGINRIPLQEGIRKNYIFSQKDGIPNEEMSDIVLLGEYLYVLSQYNVTKINQNQITQSFSPPVYLHDILLNGSPVPVNNLQSLSWGERNIQLSYHLLDYSQSGKIDYRFRLKPGDQWVYTQNNSLDLLNLNPDKYDLEIQAKDKSGQWVAAETLRISIAPPFWQTIWFISIVIFVGLLIGYAIFIRRMKELAQEKERIALQEQVSQLKQQAYRAQMNPHFIFNCMSTIQGMIIGGKTEQESAIKMISRFSLLIRSALEASHEETVYLKDELELLNNYLSLEKIRFHGSFDYEIKVDNSLEPDWVQLPPMLVQPFVENAVLHGMEGKTEGGKISVHYQNKVDYLLVTISDNGPGISTTKAQKQKNKSKYQHKSLGMTITQRRLEILNHPGYELQVDEPRDENGKITGTIITIKLPIS